MSEVQVSAPKVGPSPPTPSFVVGDWVRIKGGQGVYRVMGYSKDGSVSLYGGDKDPKGHRGARNVQPERLVVTKSPYGDR